MILIRQVRIGNRSRRRTKQIAQKTAKITKGLWINRAPTGCGTDSVAAVVAARRLMSAQVISLQLTFEKKELAGDGLTHPGNTQSGRLAFSIYGISSVEQALQRHVTQKL
jgi:hypothetical protein